MAIWELWRFRDISQGPICMKYDQEFENQPAFLSIYLKLQKHHDDQSIQGEIISNGRFVFDFSFLWQTGQKFLYSVFVCFSVSGQFLLMVDSQLLLNFRLRLQV